MGNMKTVITVKQKNLRENTEQLLCDQICEYQLQNEQYSFSYQEKKPFNGKVTIKGNQHEMSILRIAENKTFLRFKEHEITHGLVESIYGNIELEVKTRHYFKKDELIALEYDILNQGEILESYRLMIKIKRVV